MPHQKIFRRQGGSQFAYAALVGLLLLGQVLSVTAQSQTGALQFACASSFIGIATNELAGWDVTFVGDVNQDGFDDLLVAAPGNSQSGTRAGAVYLILGKQNLPALMTSLANADVVFQGVKSNLDAVKKVAGLGDVNGDGLADFMIAAPSANNNMGEIYLFWGRKTAWPGQLRFDQADVILVGEQAGDYAGMAIAAAGDVNKDGLNDFMIAAPRNDSGGKDAGKVYLFFGKQASWPKNILLSNADVTVVGEAAGDLFGLAFAGVGDVNQDGIDDIAIGAPYHDPVAKKDAGKLYLFSGDKLTPGAKIAAATAKATWIGRNAGDLLGQHISNAGDINGDGAGDFAATALLGNAAGKVYLVFGTATGWGQQIVLDDVAPSLCGEQAGDGAGLPVALLDWNKDGVADLLIGAAKNGQLTNQAGKVYFVEGKSTGWAQNVSLATAAVVMQGQQPQDNAGQALGSGDFDGDGFLEVAIGVPGSDATALNAGMANLILCPFKPKIAKIILLSPNGGEKWQVGSEHAITWISTGRIEHVRLRYSTDSGGTWKEITNSTPNDGSYNWTIPDDPSVTCLVKVEDAADGEPCDQSDQLFAICPRPVIETVIVTSPNGGEKWLVGSTQAITWNHTGTFSEVKIEYSCDNGATWQVIEASTANDGSYDWTIPNTPSNLCLVRISDKTDGMPVDISDAVFSIMLPAETITVISPNGGECWHSGSSQPIKWSSSGLISNVKIQYSLDGGKNWITIINSTPNDGHHLWQVPDVHSRNCLIKVADIDCQPEDVSDAPFTIWNKAPITVLSPNGGECLKAGHKWEIKWEACCCLDSVKIQYSIDGGQDWTMIVYGTPNDGSYLWTLPNVHSDHCLIKVADLDCDPEDISDAAFTIWGKAPITVISPNGGECLTAGQKFEIKWEGSCEFDSVKIQYSTDRGKDWMMIAYGTPNDGSYCWEVPYVHSTNCLIKVADLDCEPFDVSDSPFTIWGKPPITVISPNGGECLQAGQSFEIKWDATCSLDSLKIQFSKDGGQEWNMIVAKTPNDGSYLWTVPNVSSQNCLIKVADLDCDPFDVSDQPFTIWNKAPITVLAPNGGECLKAGDIFEIKWEAACYLDSLKLQYSIDNGANWISIVYGTANDGSYSWTVPAVNSKHCMIKVADLDCDPFDVSDKPFTICAPPFVRVLQPNGGECLLVGLQYEIKWEAACFLDSLKIQLSVDNGRNWQNIVAKTENDGSFNWTVPNSVSDSCLIKVADVDCDPFDVSDNVFAIKPQPVWQVIQPNGGEQLTAGTNVEVKWTSCGYAVDTVKIQYSIDGGKNWLSIIYRTPNDGSYVWKVPNTPGDSCLVKVADVDCDPSDVSNGFFTIKTAAVVNFDAPVMTGAGPLEVQFINLSNEVANRWQWSFGDGTVSDEKDP
ncbi:MAG: FG-GAP-like repeat-containing protein, partial [candidate division KSB1 bacterium]|nr:FG-GAP-like repeat-containing protein [candidate division KSB1 bacterium]